MQKAVHRKLRDLGFAVLVIDNKDDVLALLEELGGGGQ